MRLARLWQALENNRHCLLLKQRVTTAVLCPTQLAACSHLHLTGAVTNHSLLITVFGNLGSKTGPSTVLTEEGLQGPLQLSCLEAAVGWGALTLGQQHQGQSQQHQSHQGLPLPPSAFPLVWRAVDYKGSWADWHAPCTCILAAFRRETISAFLSESTPVEPFFLSHLSEASPNTIQHL